jgi:hypothetical protein
MDIRPVSAEQLSALKHAYVSRTTAPLDGMWLNGFVTQADHYGFYQEDNLQGFCCVNQQGFLLQFYLADVLVESTSSVFKSLFEGGARLASGAFVSTAEPHYLSLCLDYFTSFEVNSLMYQLGSKQTIVGVNSSRLERVVGSDLDKAVVFAHDAIGAPKEWLSAYFTNLIERGELFGGSLDGQLIATGECRVSDPYFPKVADIGVIVAKQERSKGLATAVLQDLVSIAQQGGFDVICSTEKSNIAAQKAIARAGFVADNRILKFEQ